MPNIAVALTVYADYAPPRLPVHELLLGVVQHAVDAAQRVGRLALVAVRCAWDVWTSRAMGCMELSLEAEL